MMELPTTPQLTAIAPEESEKKPKKYDIVDPAIISDHAFEPRGEWYTLCKHCSLAQAAHAETTVNWRDHISYVGDDDPDDD